MKIQRITLTNFGLFKDLQISLAPTQQRPNNITVFVGKNGVGKSSILTALAISLSWFISRLCTGKGSGKYISEDSILNSANFASIEIEVYSNTYLSESANSNYIDNRFKWTLVKSQKQQKSCHNNNLINCTRLANIYRNSLSDNDQINLPLIVFYPAERAVLDIPLNAGKHSFKQLDGYDNALNQDVDFCYFFEWFREREDAENESTIPQDFWNEIIPLSQTAPRAWEQLRQLNVSAKDRQLTAVRTAISQFMPKMDNLRVYRKPHLYMAIDKNGKTLDVAQLSQDEKSLMALIGDIARRLAMLNPALENPLAGDGIVLIDEVDLHLHPSWQRSFCDRLINTFPNCQFVLTTHSPLIVSDYENILVYTLNNGELQQYKN